MGFGSLDPIRKAGSGLDAAETAIHQCRQRGLIAVLGSAYQLPFTAGQFDLVMPTDCVEPLNMEDVPAAVSEIRRVSKKWVAFKICLHVDVVSWKEHVGHDLHLTVKPVSWWKQSLTQTGDRILFDDGLETFVFDISDPFAPLVYRHYNIYQTSRLWQASKLNRLHLS